MPYMDDDVRARMAELVEEIETSSFRETKWGRRGYSEREVDDFLDYLVDVLFGLLSTPVPAAVAPGSGVAAFAGEPEADEVDVVAPGSEEPDVVASASEEPDAIAPEVEEPEATVLTEDADPQPEEPGEATEVLSGEGAEVFAGEGAAGVHDHDSATPATGGDSTDGEEGPPLPPWVTPR